MLKLIIALVFVVVILIYLVVAINFVFRESWASTARACYNCATP